MLSWTKRSRLQYRRTDLSAYIDEGSELEGTYTFSGTVMLNGKFKGDIQSNDTLIVGKKGVINARIRAGTGSSATSRRRRSWWWRKACSSRGTCRMTKNRPDATWDTRDLSVVSLKR